MGKFEEAVRGVIKDLDDDDDFAEAVRQAIPVEELVREVVNSDAKVKTAVRRVVLSIVEKLDEDDDFVDVVREKMDFHQIAEEALKDPQAIKALANEVLSVIGGMNENDDFSDAVRLAIRDNFDYAELSARDERVSVAVADLVIGVIGELDKNEDAVSQIVDGISLGERAKEMAENSPEVKAALLAFVKDTIEGATTEDMLGEDGLSEMFSGVDASGMAKKLLAEDKALADAINDTVANTVTEKIRDLATDDDVEIAIDAAIADSETIKASVERAVSSLSMSGNIDTILQSAVERIIADNRNIARIVCDKVAETLSTNIVEAITRAGLSPH